MKAAPYMLSLESVLVLRWNICAIEAPELPQCRTNFLFECPVKRNSLLKTKPKVKKFSWISGLNPQDISLWIWNLHDATPGSPLHGCLEGNLCLRCGKQGCKITSEVQWIASSVPWNEASFGHAISSEISAATANTLLS